MRRPCYIGDRVRLVGDDLATGMIGIVEDVVTWRDAILPLGGAEARALTARIDARMAAHGGRAAWARIAVRWGGRLVTVEAPGFVIVEARGAKPAPVPVAPADEVNDGILQAQAPRAD